MPNNYNLYILKNAHVASVVKKIEGRYLKCRQQSELQKKLLFKRPAQQGLVTELSKILE